MANTPLLTGGKYRQGFYAIFKAVEGTKKQVLFKVVL
jgi:hypothetical protein